LLKLHGGLDAPVAVALMALFCLAAGLSTALFGAMLAWTAKCEAGFSRKALALAPCLWVTIELLRGYIWDFPWNPLGTAQIDNIPLARIATITGVYGVSFEIMIVNVAFAAAFLVRPRRRRELLAAAAVCAALLQGSALLPAPAEAHTQTAVLVQHNLPINEDGASWTAESYDKTLAEFAQLSTQKGSGANLIVWPESPLPAPLESARFTSPVVAMAKANHAWALVGATAAAPADETGEKVYNSAALFAPDGRLAGRYDKVHLVPWGEYVPMARYFSFAKALTAEVGDFTPGLDRHPLAAGDQTLGVLICYEAVFPDEARQFANRGAQVLINMSDDAWFGASAAPWQHFRMARMRAVENDRWLLRATNNGVTASIDPLGRVAAQLPREQRGALIAPYEAKQDVTFYSQHGDWFALLCAAVTVVGLCWRVRAPREIAPPTPVN